MHEREKNIKIRIIKAHVFWDREYFKFFLLRMLRYKSRLSRPSFINNINTRSPQY